MTAKRLRSLYERLGRSRAVRRELLAELERRATDVRAQLARLDEAERQLAAADEETARRLVGGA